MIRLRPFVIAMAVAAVVLFVLALWAAASDLGTCWGISSAVWLTAGLLTLAVLALVHVLYVRS
jgi:hypothetical protein